MGRWIPFWMVGLFFWMAATLAQDPSVVLPQGEIRGVSFCLILKCSFPYFGRKTFFFLFPVPSLLFLLFFFGLFCLYSCVHRNVCTVLFGGNSVLLGAQKQNNSGHLPVVLLDSTRKCQRISLYQAELSRLTRRRDP